MGFNIFWVHRGPGSLGLMTQPNPNAAAHEVARLGELNIDEIYFLMHPLSDTDYRRISSFYRHRFTGLGIRITPFPIVDFEAPEMARATRVATEAAQKLLQGKSIVFQCIESTGRSPTMAIATLMKLGFSLQQSRESVLAARGLDSLDAEPQRIWLEDFDKNIALEG